jgi:hypothetical protein
MFSRKTRQTKTRSVEKAVHEKVVALTDRFPIYPDLG